ncbi:MAG TPA: 23S rRNA (pseudouridine(1915)-N(3))-methyltransferase RlmH [Usitatibacter sp.]|jgi:23S rRNA (pseudouridine1915-N3)-methyltransferase|nr:23S rRNA (pseudouridine(1915)-N(3))-methyltransferase RlmH [Usitatibacter sp.]
MRIAILSVGHKMPEWIQQGFQEYARRMPPEARLELVEVKPGRDRAEEGRRLLDALPARATLVALDERGKALSTADLANAMGGWMRDAVQPAFAIGGADGLDAAVKERAAMTWSLSSLTFPHQLVRVVLAEQLYRAWSILAGHPYHRE